MMLRLNPKVVSALRNGLHRRCPRCGEAPLFEGFFQLQERCPKCQLELERNAGDTWALWLIGDRVFIAFIIIAVFLVFRSDSWTFGLAITICTVIPLFATMPHRMGLCLAIDYLVRSTWGDLAIEGHPPKRPAEPG